ncbi:MAG: hypothetical protein J6Q22_08365 [Prevotella sp.]|nr:hypothetical protein [Prevotella sp.]
MATWKDDISATCKAGLELDGKAISSGTKLSDPGKLKLTVTDETGNSASAEITLTKTDSQAPAIEVKISKKNVVAGVKIKIEGNQLFFDDQVAATWTDDFTEICSALLSLDGQAVNSGEILLETGKLVIAVSDDFKNETKAEITLLAEAVYGLENLQGKTLQVDQEVNMLEGITFANGLTLQKVEIEQDGQRSEIANPEAFTPEVPEPISIIFTLARTDGSTIEVKVENLTVRGFQYQSISITDLKPVEILPIIGQIEGGDKNAYDHIEHLRVAEVTRIRDMMLEYGAGKHSPEEYKKLMGRLNIGIKGEIPLGYDNYEIICSNPATEPTSHASHQWSILNSLIQYANNKVLPEEYENSWQHNLMVFLENHPNSINVFWCSAYSDAYNLSDYYGWMFEEDILDLSNKKNLIFFAYASNMLYRSYGS